MIEIVLTYRLSEKDTEVDPADLIALTLSVAHLLKQEMGFTVQDADVKVSEIEVKEVA